MMAPTKRAGGGGLLVWWENGECIVNMYLGKRDRFVFGQSHRFL